MLATTDDLEPLDPETAIELFLDDKAVSCTEETVRNHRYGMNHFLEWCDRDQIENLDELSGRDSQQNRLWLGEKNDISALSLKNQLSGFRVFLRWAGSVEAVPRDLYTELTIPRVRRSERSCEQILEAERAKELLEYLARHEYASIEHVLLAFLRETGMRIGAANSVDLEDVSFDDECVELRHRRYEGPISTYEVATGSKLIGCNRMAVLNVERASSKGNRPESRGISIHVLRVSVPTRGRDCCVMW